ncbi:GNAT family N-acetyltransferase [Dyadobacter sp. CY107]|uniref:GNAT family N-acetyltransferase n=1 Tax=Dyadobacter fanqingshengii TaxID=2906443 RepID=UPI001F3E5B18|nr:GNAT family N-acetyltransferase [Dyadobacter fanqingshengii]MCF2504420.1 GNAT family N-acetyltransferase [Dyadobacter fanqingshengii]
MDLKLDWHFKTFDELNTRELYDILQLRNEVFVVEQKCCFLDLDGKDQKSHHLSGYQNGKLMAFSRIVPPGVSYEYVSIGRIAVSGQGRGMGFGIELLNESIKKVELMYGKSIIRIGAQLYLKTFYGSFGFIQSSDIYLEDDIEHIEMTRQITR